MFNFIEAIKNLPDDQKSLILFGICLASLVGELVLPGQQPILDAVATVSGLVGLTMGIPKPSAS